ncbi:MAG: type II toxin-antitoxin system MqsR family toxin [Geobacteraceae bacterium]|nr:type II toxin-antitoxin system MqsR family toxin [Geobacteraceae bacterium]
MEKRKPHCGLDALKMLLLHEATRIVTRSGRQGAAKLGYFDDETMVARVLRLTPREFYKSMTTHANTKIWQDVYRTKDGDVGIYVNCRNPWTARGLLFHSNRWMKRLSDMYKQGDACPLCGDGLLCEKVLEEHFSYKGHSLTVPDYCILECPACGEAFVDKDSARRAEKLLRDFGRQVDGLLMPVDIKRIRRRLHLTQEQMATVLGGGLKSFARYENGQVVQSRAMDNLLRILDRFPESLDVLPGVPRPQAVVMRKRSRAVAGMACEADEEYKGKR